MEQEGVIKYRLDHTESELDIGEEVLRDINLARKKMLEHQMIGQTDDRYDGYGFGNLSLRADDFGEFWISGTQTGALSTLTARDLALVQQSYVEQNALTSLGLTKPSSEALTHSVLFALDPRICAVIHVHDPLIWQSAGEMSLAQTAPDTPYGTPQMATEMHQIASDLIKSGLPLSLVMAGHQDGVITAGRTLSECADQLVALQERAKSHAKRRG